MSFMYNLVIFVRRTRKKAKRFINRNAGTIVVTGLLSAGVTLGVVFMLMLGSYQEKYAIRDLGRDKYYVSYMVLGGDTLWDIATDVATINPEYPSVNAALHEIRSINGIYNDKIISGETILLPCYTFGQDAQDAMAQYDVDPLYGCGLQSKRDNIK